MGVQIFFTLSTPKLRYYKLLFDAAGIAVIRCLQNITELGTFAPAASHTSTKLIVLIATRHGCHLECMDIDTPYLKIEFVMNKEWMAKK